VKADIVYVSMAGFGHTGPYVDYQTYAYGQAVSGLTFQSGFGHAAGRLGFLTWTTPAAISAAWRSCRRCFTGVAGQGQHVDLASGSGDHFTGPAILDYQVNGRPSSRIGNRSGHLAMAARRLPLGP
jgi:crotonobetainyl-CoA:carnitine CoA-transferase CaiB-like acyl-CoA transferase